MKKNRRDFTKDGLAAAAAILSGSAVYWASQGNEHEDNCYPDTPTYSVSVSPSKYQLGTCRESYDLEQEEVRQRPAGIPEELYENSSAANSIK